MRDLKKGFVNSIKIDFISIKMNYLNEEISTATEISVENYPGPRILTCSSV
jgi:hypothetical protein